ncbi:DinB family protein [Streptomyces pimonensis]|uniref:DinB family protein n=1 Tax=Streptomyces pimonensis TaxID=2860288 RepID=A0ABV4IUF5_9ACTN
MVCEGRSVSVSRNEPASRYALDLLRRQFDLTWSLFEYHLERLEPDDFLWEPVGNCWTVRRAGDGTWVPDFAESEPDPVPVPTIGWLSWHIGWWWSVTIDHARGREPRQRDDITWPGAGEPTVEWLRGLRADWLEALDRLTGADLDSTAPFPWQNDPRHTVAHMIAWVNAELMKNAAEIGQLRLQRAADRPSAVTS